MKTIIERIDDMVGKEVNEKLNNVQINTIKRVIPIQELKALVKKEMPAATHELSQQFFMELGEEIKTGRYF